MSADNVPITDHILGLSQAGFHRFVYYAWAPAATSHRDTVAVHGLTRTGRDFDAIAARLAQDRKVVCPDIVGRGQSDWLAPPAPYDYTQYQADLTALIAHMGSRQVDWIGTSMGGLLGLTLAAQPNTPIRRLVLNDVGPFVPRDALTRIGRYVGADPHFPDFDAATAYIQTVHAEFGSLTESQWRHLTRHAIRPDSESGYRLAYDPRIAEPFADPTAIGDIDLWPLWHAITCPVLVIHGETSDLLTQATVNEMTRIDPRARVITVPDTGHAPPLMAPRLIDQIRTWLDQD